MERRNRENIAEYLDKEHKGNWQTTYDTYESIVWKLGYTPPSKTDLEAAVGVIKSAWDAQEYARNRAKAYPSIGDQLDMQYHDQLDGTTTWKDAIAKVKSDNPK